MSGYLFRDDETGDISLSALEFAHPTPIHAQGDAARAAAVAIRAHGERIRAQRASIVTDHGNPRVEPFNGDVVTRNARALIALAEACGFQVRLFTFPASCRVEGYHAGRAVGFRATWTRGRADRATWSTPWRYGIVEDHRPVAASKTSRTGLAGKRAAGMGTTRLDILGSPWGVPISHTDLTARLRDAE